MCGIVAALGRTNIQPAMDLISHRGIRQRIVQGSRGSVGHVRLPIVGVGTENDQPHVSYPWTIAFVGEVLDFKERGSPHDCDLHTVVDNWEREGPLGMREHDGFWAIVALDHRDGNLHVLTDYLSQKPMYYRRDLKAVASEPAALAVLGPTKPDRIYLSAVIKWGYCPEGWRTPYHEIVKMDPGEHLMIRPDGTSTRKIVDRLTSNPSISEVELKAEIIAAVCRRTLSSDVPVAALLSGGLDSSIVYTVASRYSDAVVPYFVHGGNDPIKPAKLIAGDRLIERSISAASTDRATCLEYMQEPLDLGSLVPQIELARSITQTVCLTGDGADEAFGGYGRSMRYDSQGSDLWHELVNWHLPRLDRVMMRHRIEVRSPFLARRVVEGAMGLPWERRRNKVALRDMFRFDIPEEIAMGQKVPLRTSHVENHREMNSIALVQLFQHQTWPQLHGVQS